MRSCLTVAIIALFLVLGVVDIFDGEFSTGVASVLLAIVNGLLLGG